MGATVATGKGVTFFRWLSLRGMVSLEGKGLRHSSRRSVTALVKRELGLSRGTPREKVLEAIERKLNELREEARQEGTR